MSILRKFPQTRIREYGHTVTDLTIAVNFLESLVTLCNNLAEAHLYYEASCFVASMPNDTVTQLDAETKCTHITGYKSHLAIVGQGGHIRQQLQDNLILVRLYSYLV